MKYLFCLLLFCVTAMSISAQKLTPEFGHPNEMKGLTKLYIETQADIKTYDRLIKEIKNNKNLRAIIIVTNLDDSDMVMTYAASTERQEVPTSVFAPQGGITLNQGEGRIVVPNQNGTNIRILLRYYNSQESDWEQKPTTKFVKEFAKAYKTANSVK